MSEKLDAIKSELDEIKSVGGGEGGVEKTGGVIANISEVGSVNVLAKTLKDGIEDGDVVTVLIDTQDGKRWKGILMGFENSCITIEVIEPLSRKNQVVTFPVSLLTEMVELTKR